MIDQKTLVTEEIKKLLYEDFDKTLIRQIIKAWIPEISKRSFEKYYFEAFTTL